MWPDVEAHSYLNSCVIFLHVRKRVCMLLHEQLSSHWCRLNKEVKDEEGVRIDFLLSVSLLPLCALLPVCFSLRLAL